RRKGPVEGRRRRSAAAGGLEDHADDRQGGGTDYDGGHDDHDDAADDDHRGAHDAAADHLSRPPAGPGERRRRLGISVGTLAAVPSLGTVVWALAGLLVAYVVWKTGIALLRS